MSMMDWNEYRKQLAGAVGTITQLNPDMVAGYRAMSGAGKQVGGLGDKMRELIALSAAISLRCDGCIAVHTAAALKAGATEAEIAETLGVAISINAGAAMVYSARAMDAVAEYQAHKAGKAPNNKAQGAE